MKELKKQIKKITCQNCDKLISTRVPKELQCDCSIWHRGRSKEDRLSAEPEKEPEKLI